MFFHPCTLSSCPDSSKHGWKSTPEEAIRLRYWTCTIIICSTWNWIRKSIFFLFFVPFDSEPLSLCRLLCNTHCGLLFVESQERVGSGCQTGSAVCVPFLLACVDNGNKGNQLNSCKVLVVEEIEKWDIIYSKWEGQGRSWGCRIWIGVCVFMCVSECVKELCLRSLSWELSVWPSRCVCRWLSRLVRPLRRWLRDSSNDRLWRVKTWVCVCVAPGNG